MKGTVENKLLLLLFVTALLSCGKKQLSPADYMQWMNNPESIVNHQKDIGDYTVQVKYLPHDYLILQNLKKKNIAVAEYEQEKGKFSGHKYFLFRIKSKSQPSSPMHTNIYSYNDYQSRLNYLAFESGNDFKLISNNDTIPCVLSHFENNYNSAPVNDILLVFKDSSSEDKITFVWNDKLYGLGNVKFIINQSEIFAQAPTLKLY